jgi:Adenylate cyclase, family 3 (some proteins contain HAMP domain)
MEQNLAILIADLAGYTALTETHGSSTAADTIDKYLSLVNDSLVGESMLHQCVGDEVVIVSPLPDHLICTAVMLLQKCFKEHNFLQLHGGLHYGKLLKRNDNYFGSTINIASRIAAKANKGTFWCSGEFVNALADKEEFTFLSKGKHIFKNVNEEVEVLELVIDNTITPHIDPVCRMLIHKKETAVPHPEDDIFFCSDNCRDIYLQKSQAEI